MPVDSLEANTEPTFGIFVYIVNTDVGIGIDI